MTSLPSSHTGGLLEQEHGSAAPVPFSHSKRRHSAHARTACRADERGLGADWLLAMPGTRLHAALLMETDPGAKLAAWHAHRSYTQRTHPYEKTDVLGT